MAFPRHPPSFDSDMQLPIVLVPDVDEDTMDSELEAEPKVRHRPREKAEAPGAPQHPIPAMQDAFAESLIEATQGENGPKPKLRTGDARARREELLDGKRTDDPPGVLWRRRPGQTMHELRRLMAQISFGVYLLLNGMANSQALVVSILQGHIDEVDEFLETTLEDVGLATKDLSDRVQHLKLPMENLPVFERMLEDRNFRLQILEGNEKIEHILVRTQTALEQTMQDIAEGMNSTKEFTVYLADQQHGQWRRERPDVIDIFDAMKGNTDGWLGAFEKLQAQGAELNALVLTLSGMISEMERRAGQVSRRTRFSVEPYSTPGHSPRPSNASSSILATPPASPPPKIPNTPPRLSLRLSIANKLGTSQPSSLFDIGTISESALTSTTQSSVFADGPSTEKEVVPFMEKEVVPFMEKEVVPEIYMEKEVVPCTEKEVVMVEVRPPPSSPPPPTPPLSLQPSQPRSPPARNPRRLSERPRAIVETPTLEAPMEKEEDEESALYILQPRTYTPVPPSPQPSPGLVEDRAKAREPPRPRHKPSQTTIETASPVRLEAPKPRNNPPATIESASPVRMAAPRPRIEQVAARAQPNRPRVVEIGPAARRGPRPDSRPIQAHDPRPEPRREPRLDPQQAPEPLSTLEPEPEPPRQRTSLRDRVSPPESIQVPPPDAFEARRPVRVSRQACQAPDSAYGSDIERPPVNSMASINSSLADFSPPVMHPGLVPSPHSDKQFFRPVQAHPYSPLQQRPHTSGTVAPHLQPPPRNTPSAMGMSIRSNTTTMTNGSTSSKTLKKKRSAFGWLKKAFALDEEERAAFEQRKMMEQRNDQYQNGRSPQFLDGRRLPPQTPRPTF